MALAAVINYIDRQAFGALWPDIAKDLFPEMDLDPTKAIYGTISAVFILSYAAGQTIFGKIFDWIGTRIGFALSIGIWSIATMINAFAIGMVSFSIFRLILVIAEAGNWPDAANANAEWFPTKERAFAQGVFNSGATEGIGFEVAKRLGKDVYTVVLNGIDDSAGPERVKELTAEGITAKYYGFDVTNEDLVSSNIKKNC